LTLELSLSYCWLCVLPSTEMTSAVADPSAFLEPAGDQRGRRRWVMGQPSHVLPTEAGDYVLLTKPRPPGSPQLPPIEESDPSRPSFSQKPFTAESQGQRPFTPASQGQPPPGPRTPELNGILRVRPLQRAPPVSYPQVGGWSPAAGTSRSVARMAREQSVQRLRDARAREGAQLSAALLASKREAVCAPLTGPPAHADSLRTSVEEEAQLTAAIEASLSSRDLSTEEEAHLVAAIEASQAEARYAATHHATRHASGASSAGPSAELDSSHSLPQTAAEEEALVAKAIQASLAVQARCTLTTPDGGACGSATGSADGPAGTRPTSSPTVASGGVRPEERQQLELAVAESLRTEAARAADTRHDDDATLLGLLDSLGQTRPRSRGGAASQERRGRGERIGTLHHNALPGERVVTAREAGRALALSTLEAHFMSGDGIR